MERVVKVTLGTFACNGIRASLGSDVGSGVRAALRDFTERIEAGRATLGVPLFAQDLPAEEAEFAAELPLDEHTLLLLEREAARQGASVSQLVAHSVLVYLADLDRLTPPDGAGTV